VSWWLNQANHNGTKRQCLLPLDAIEDRAQTIAARRVQHRYERDPPQQVRAKIFARSSILAIGAMSRAIRERGLQLIEFGS
jgi:hypothetical protein